MGEIVTGVAGAHEVTTFLHVHTLVRTLGRCKLLTLVVLGAGPLIRVEVESGLARAPVTSIRVHTTSLTPALIHQTLVHVHAHTSFLDPIVTMTTAALEGAFRVDANLHVIITHVILQALVHVDAYVGIADGVDEAVEADAVVTSHPTMPTLPVPAQLLTRRARVVMVTRLAIPTLQVRGTTPATIRHRARSTRTRHPVETRMLAVT